MYIFSEYTDINEIFRRYDAANFVNMQIGYDGRIYILFNAKIPERINGMFVPTVSDSRYCVLALDADWDSGRITGESFYDLGMQKMNYHFVQKVSDGILLVGSRCMCVDGVGENNAAVFDEHGSVLREYCLGDGIEDCIVLPDGRIVTGYFDEGVFGNYGWDEPIGAAGLAVWENGNIIWEADSGICDCYAMNTDDSGRIWYYYYTDFELVCTDFMTEQTYQPGIDGANIFILTEDRQSVIFDAGYDRHGSFVKEHFKNGSLCGSEDVRFDFGGEEINIAFCTARGSRAAFIDSSNRLFLKRFLT